MTWYLCYKRGTGRAVAHPQQFKSQSAAQDFADKHGWDHMQPVEVV